MSRAKAAARVRLARKRRAAGDRVGRCEICNDWSDDLRLRPVVCGGDLKRMLCPKCRQPGLPF